MKDILITWTSNSPYYQQKIFKALEKINRRKNIKITNFKFPTISFKGFKRTKRKHNLGYRPIIFLWVEKIGGRKKRCPMFYFHGGFISETDFYFYHEPYSKKEFIFRYKIYKNTDPILVDEKIV
jgi:hypothetical protein